MANERLQHKAIHEKWLNDSIQMKMENDSLRIQVQEMSEEMPLLRIENEELKRQVEELERGRASSQYVCARAGFWESEVARLSADNKLLRKRLRARDPSTVSEDSDFFGRLLPFCMYLLVLP